MLRARGERPAEKVLKSKEGGMPLWDRIDEVRGAGPGRLAVRRGGGETEKERPVWKSVPEGHVSLVM